jgi:hypothetical protein
MKKLAVRIGILVVSVMFLTSCGTLATKSEFWQHDTLYKNWDHTHFSLCGYKEPTAETGMKSQEQGWWGIEIVGPALKQ